MMNETMMTRRRLRRHRLDALQDSCADFLSPGELAGSSNAPKNSCVGATNQGRQSGFSLVEVMVSLAVVAIALGLLVSSMLALTHARRQSNERHQITTVMSRALETLESLGPTDAFLDYAPAPDGTPFPSDGSGFGESFDVPGIQDGDSPDSATIQISFLVDETEDSPELGLPRDLDGDGEINNTNVTALDEDGKVMATLLPVRLIANWRSFNGQQRTITWSTMIVSN